MSASAEEVHVWLTVISKVLAPFIVTAFADKRIVRRSEITSWSGGHDNVLIKIQKKKNTTLIKEQLFKSNHTLKDSAVEVVGLVFALQQGEGENYLQGGGGAAGQMNFKCFLNFFSTLETLLIFNHICKWRHNSLPFTLTHSHHSPGVGHVTPVRSIVAVLSELS